MTTTTSLPLPDATTCYRHAERESAIRCQRCSRRICTDCMVSAPVGFQCPDCVSAGAKQTRAVMGLSTAMPVLTYTLMAVNFAVAMVSLTASDGWAEGRIDTVAINGGLLGGGVVFDGRGPEFIGIHYGEWYRVFTSAFIHGGLMHILFNMLALWQVGMLIERSLGPARFAMLYLVSILGGAFGALLLQPDAFTVGASGGVFGLMGALFVAQRLGLPAMQGSAIGVFIGLNLVITFAVPGISVGGHLGGLIAGGAVGWAMYEFERRRLPVRLPFGMTASLCFVLFLGCLWASRFWMDPLF